MASGNFFGGQFFGGGFFGELISSEARPSGGTPAGSVPTTLRVPARTRSDIAKARNRFGIPDDAAETIAEVAARQVERLELDAQKRFEELARELELRRIEWKSEYLAELDLQRERLQTAEIAARLRAIMRVRSDEEAILLLLLIAAAAA